MQKAELIKCRRTESIINEEFLDEPSGRAERGFLDHSKGQESFLDYFKQCMNKTTGKLGGSLQALRQIFGWRVPLR